MTSGDQAFGGQIGRTYHESRAWWPEPVSTPTGAPNIVFIVLDDVGFAHLGCYGSDIATPNMDGLAAGGLRYTGFHTTAMCSPTRAALLSGRNHHAAGVGAVAEFAVGFPGYQGALTKRAATLGELLGPLGYSTMAVGKWHLMPLRDVTAAGPFDYWPTQRGFDRWYGFPGGYTDQWHPELYDGTTAVEVAGGEGYHLTDDLIDRAIEYVRDQQSAAPQRPFFLYVALGACHWPHQVPSEYVERYRGRYDRGWDVARQEWLTRQKAMGIVPPEVELPAANPGVPSWESLTPDERRVAACHMEVYAGFLEHTDAQIGRLVDYLEAIGQLDNTLLMLISDNGASGEGGRLGAVNVDLNYQAGGAETLEAALEALPRLGDETTNPHYPIGWAQAGNTPLKWYKTDVHGGGVRDPLIVHWPARIRDGGSLRHQYHHVVDLTPTVLELLGVEAPTVVKGVPQLPIHGVSLAYTFDHPDACTRKQAQYYEMLGDRAMWDRGWKAVVRHTRGADFDADRWELYHLAEDYAEAHDLAEQEPGRLRALIERWWASAGEHGALPLDDRGADRTATGGRRDPRTTFRFRPGMARIERWNTPNVTNRSFSIEADVSMAPGAGGTPTKPLEGVLLAVGNRFGGYVLFVKDGCLTFEYNAGHSRYTIRSERPIADGASRLGFEFVKTGHLQGHGRLLADGEPVGAGDLRRTWPINPARSSLYCGRDGGSPVSEAYACPFTFTGTLRQVVVTLGDDQQRDPAADRRAEMAED
jgi:arylsulfatase A-like enzyme